MATIAGILEGKASSFFKLEELGENAFIITESIDPRKTEIRSEKVKPKEGSNREEIEYFHILGRLGDVEKDLSLTYTALKQLSALMPREENWRGYSIKYTGTRGTGKNIKYGYQVLGKVEISQSRLEEAPAPLADPAAIILEKLKKNKKTTDDGFWAMATQETGGLSNAARCVEKLKTRGMVVYRDGFWEAV